MHVQGVTRSTEVLNDVQFGISVENSAHLHRSVQMCFKTRLSKCCFRSTAHNTSTLGKSPKHDTTARYQWVEHSTTEERVTIGGKEKAHRPTFPTTLQPAHVYESRFGNSQLCITKLPYIPTAWRGQGRSTVPPFKRHRGQPC